MFRLPAVSVRCRLACCALLVGALAVAACSSNSTGGVPYVPPYELPDTKVPDTAVTDATDLEEVVDAEDAASDVPVQDTTVEDFVPYETSTCSCEGIGCGIPPGCTKSCGGCGDGQVCVKNKCEDDPGCACGSASCGIKSGCSKDCGLCDGNDLCEDNICTKNCTCAGLECGSPSGCANKCGACELGKLCDSSNICVADPKCACKPGTCGLVSGCAKACGGCTDPESCINNQCMALAKCDCTGVGCGFPDPVCTKSCGTCGLGQVCQEGKCLAEKPTKRKYGEACGANDDCQPPPPGGSQFAQNAYLTCLHNQCESNLCLSAFGTPGAVGGGVCTKACVTAQDLFNNATGGGGADGIEDAGAVSQCAGAADGTSGKTFRCAEQASPYQVSQGQTEQFCLAGSGFKPCSRTGDCVNGEICRIYLVGGDLHGRCGPRIHNPNGSKGNPGGLACNENPVNGPTALCENGFCTPAGCAELCVNDADCMAPVGICKAGKCGASNTACQADGDCPAWKCTADVTVLATSATTFSVCQP
ncbi:MAG: hypothetical protein ACOYOB_10175 [Myxococcota bacterium]